MGQYRQWLHYRHVDQQLQSQKQQLTGAMTRIQERINSLNAHPLAIDNPIVQALRHYPTICPPSSEILSEEGSLENGHKPSERMSQALFDHSRLPDLDLLHGQNTHEAVFPKRPTNPFIPLPPILHKAIDLVPEESNTLPDEHEPTEPQIALPQGFQDAAIQGSSLDAQSMRTNRLVQRWLERWGRQEELTQEPTITNGQQTPVEPEGL